MILHESVINKTSIKVFHTLTDKFSKIHGSYYDYSKVVYYGTKTPITITCPIHGSFEQLPYRHLQGRGCTKCGLNRLSIYKTDSLESFKAKALLKHGTKYNYLNLSVVNSKSIITYYCIKHGNITQKAASHLSGCGCKQCGIEARASIRIKTEAQVIVEFKEIHKDKYDYSNMKYLGAKHPIVIICPVHGPFEQTPDNHLSGCGCPSCATTGFDPSKPGILYYLSINNGQAYKIGITNRSVKHRYTNIDLAKIKILHQVHYINGAKAYDEERRIMTHYSKYKYKGPPLLRDGNTELFNCNILNL